MTNYQNEQFMTEVEKERQLKTYRRLAQKDPFYIDPQGISNAFESVGRLMKGAMYRVNSKNRQ